MRTTKEKIRSLEEKKALYNKTRMGLPLYLEIMLILIFKIILLTLIWKFCFSNSQTKHMTLPKIQVEQHFFSSPPVDQSL